MHDNDDVTTAVSQLRALLADTIAELAATADKHAASGEGRRLFFPGGIGKIFAKISLSPIASVEIEIAHAGATDRAPREDVSVPIPRMAHPLYVHNDGDTIVLAVHDTTSAAYGPDFVVLGNQGSIVDAIPPT